MFPSNMYKREHNTILHTRTTPHTRTRTTHTRAGAHHFNCRMQPKANYLIEYICKYPIRLTKKWVPGLFRAFLQPHLWLPAKVLRVAISKISQIAMFVWPGAGSQVAAWWSTRNHRRRRRGKRRALLAWHGRAFCCGKDVDRNERLERTRPHQSPLSPNRGVMFRFCVRHLDLSDWDPPAAKWFRRRDDRPETRRCHRVLWRPRLVRRRHRNVTGRLDARRCHSREDGRLERRGRATETWHETTAITTVFLHRRQRAAWAWGVRKQRGRLGLADIVLEDPGEWHSHRTSAKGLIVFPCSHSVLPLLFSGGLDVTFLHELAIRANSCSRDRERCVVRTHYTTHKLLFPFHKCQYVFIYYFLAAVVYQVFS